MSYAKTKGYVESQVINYFTANYPDWQIKVPLLSITLDGSSRVQIDVSDGLGYRTNIGQRYYERVPGEAFLELTVPVDTNEGTKELDTITSDLKKLFQERHVKIVESGAIIKFGIVSWANNGDVGDRTHYHVIVPYVRHEPPQYAVDTVFT